MSEYEALRTAFVRLLDAVEEEGPGSETARAIAAEVRSAGVEPGGEVEHPEAWYHEHPAGAARYCLGQLLDLLDWWPTADDPLRRLVIGQSVINVARRFERELLPVALD